MEGTQGLDLHHFYRAMAWLGDNKDNVEEGLFLKNRDLFSGLNLVFFDTTSIYPMDLTSFNFEGDGGESLGQYGYSRDRRPDEKQMVVGAVIDFFGMPISCPMWLGNTADIKTLIWVIEGLKNRFGVRDMVVVADRVMVSKETVGELDRLGVGYILGAKMRKEKEVSVSVLGGAGRYREVKENLKVKEVEIDTKDTLCV